MRFFLNHPFLRRLSYWLYGGIFLVVLLLSLLSSGPLSGTITLVEVGVDRFFPDDAVVNVQAECNLVGDGVTDDTTALKECLQQFMNENEFGKGVTLYFPNGTYLIRDSIVWKNFIIFQGQNRTKTILKLADRTPGFQDVDQPKIVLGVGTNQQPNYGVGFSASVYNLTIDVGSGNPGAIGVGYYGNNESTLREVTIRSSDRNKVGAIGLRLMEGGCPGFIQNARIEGFNLGIWVSSGTFCAFEHTQLIGQRVAGIFSELDSHACSTLESFRDLRSINTVPVVLNECKGTTLVILDSAFSGGRPLSAAIVTDGPLFARNVTATGYSTIVRDRFHNRSIGRDRLTEYASEHYRLFPGANTSLNLPVEETPEIQYEPVEQWVSVAEFGAQSGDDIDDTVAIQAAIDSGARTIYFPPSPNDREGEYRVSDTIVIRGNVQYIIGMHQQLNGIDHFKNNPDTLFRIENTNHEYVVFERLRHGWWGGQRNSIHFLHASAKPLILRDLGSTPVWEYVYQSTPESGTVFFENVVGGRVAISPNQKAYARQLNLESQAENAAGTVFDNDHPPLLNRGGKLWVMGSKLESAQLIAKTIDGGQTELIGFNPLNVQQSLNEMVAFEAIDSTQSIVALLASFGNEEPCCYINYGRAVREIRNGVTRELPMSEVRLGQQYPGGISGPNRSLTLYTSAE
jgi:hypothetical protein